MQDIINNFPNKDDVLEFVNKIVYICEIFAMFTLTML